MIYCGGCKWKKGKVCTNPVFPDNLKTIPDSISGQMIVRQRPRVEDDNCCVFAEAK